MSKQHRLVARGTWDAVSSLTRSVERISADPAHWVSNSPIPPVEAPLIAMIIDTKAPTVNQDEAFKDFRNRYISGWGVSGLSEYVHRFFYPRSVSGEADADLATTHGVATASFQWRIREGSALYVLEATNSEGYPRHFMNLVAGTAERTGMAVTYSQDERIWEN